MKYIIIWKDSGQPYRDDTFDSRRAVIVEIGRISEDALALQGKLTYTRAEEK